MALKIKLSKNFEAVRSRVRRLPKFYGEMMSGVTKRDAIGVQRTFGTGISGRKFGLTPLKSETILSKQEKGFSKPSTPLYGEGESDERSYLNMMEVKKTKNGWSVGPSKRLHHSRKIRLKKLLEVHEFGKTISRGSGVIRIPPRPAFNRAFNQWLRKKKKIDPASKIRKAVNQLIKEGKDNLQKRIALGDV